MLFEHGARFLPESSLESVILASDSRDSVPELAVEPATSLSPRVPQVFEANVWINTHSKPLDLFFVAVSGCLQKCRRDGDLPLVHIGHGGQCAIYFNITRFFTLYIPFIAPRDNGVTCLGGTRKIRNSLIKRSLQLAAKVNIGNHSN